MITILSIIVLIFSAIIHEYAHGYAAYRMGDHTAKNAGRLTLNPLPHLDLFGSILLPLLMALSKVGFVLGWAKPVPYNPNNLNDQKFGDAKVAIAGPASNFAAALLCGVIFRFLPVSQELKYSLTLNFLQGQSDVMLNLMHGSIFASLSAILIVACLINILLGVFNLLPMPPLDGSKIITVFLNYELRARWLSLEHYGIFILLIALYLGALDFIWPFALKIFLLIVGI